MAVYNRLKDPLKKYNVDVEDLLHINKEELIPIPLKNFYFIFIEESRLYS